MVKITVCDCCKKEGILTETIRYLKVTNRTDLRLDLCDKHINEVQQKYPIVTPEYIQYVYSLNNVPIDIETAKSIQAGLRGGK
jgi:hypothetical protein